MKTIIVSAPMILYTKSALVLLVTIIFVTAELQFEWNKNDARFDCVVAISADDKPIGTGVFIALDSVITSANVVEQYALDKLKVHVVHRLYNESKAYTVGCMASAFGPGVDRKGSGYWLQHGSQKEEQNSPLHDLYTLSLNANLEDPDSDLTEWGYVSIASKNKGNFKYVTELNPTGTYQRLMKERWPFIVQLIYGNNFMYADDYMWGGFGYLSRQHVSKSTWIEMEIYGADEVQVDCDEWIPREWGRFICIENVNSVPGLASGAPLFHRGRLVGVGSFMLDKNDESILVFTDLRPYVNQMVICANTGRLYNESEKISHSNVKYSVIFEKDAKFAKRLKF